VVFPCFQQLGESATVWPAEKFRFFNKNAADAAILNPIQALC
jgi:hypothetical protein